MTTEKTSKLSQGLAESRIRQLLDRALEASLVIGGLKHVNTTITAKTAPITKQFGGVVRTSFLYRWLTKEPEPEVIVIDLRETWTVGPVITLLDWIVAWLEPFWRSSRIRDLLKTAGSLIRWAGESPIVKRLVRLLEMPEPPKRNG